MKKHLSHHTLSVVILSSLLLAGSSSLKAQLRGDHLLGLVGLQSGTQAPAGLNAVLIPAYFYTTDRFKNADGDVSAKNLGMVSYLTAPAFSWVIKPKILGGNLGGSVLIPFVTNKIEAGDADSRSSFNLSDIYLQPVQMGWHFKQVDVTGAFALYIPAGKYTLGDDNNSGLGMWGYEFSAGSTVFFDKKKEWNASALLSYELNSKKKDSEMRVGNVLTIEGGAGKTWYKKTKGPVPVIFNAGLNYYMQFKTTGDQIPLGSTSYFLATDKDRVFGLGAEGNVFIPSIRSLITLRWISELGAVNRFQGNTFLLSWAYNIKTFK